MTEWRRINLPRYRNYEVSDDGRVRRDGRELTGYVDRYGYRTVLLSYVGLKQRFKVHRLVCEAFNGPCPVDFECGHLNGDPRDNRASNLKWISRAENIEHTFLHERRKRGVTSYKRRDEYKRAINRNAAGFWVKLSDAEVAEMRRRHKGGESAYSLARAFGVCKRTAQRIVNGEVRQGAPETPQVQP